MNLSNDEDYEDCCVSIETTVLSEFAFAFSPQFSCVLSVHSIRVQSIGLLCIGLHFIQTIYPEITLKVRVNTSDA